MTWPDSIVFPKDMRYEPRELFEKLHLQWLKDYAYRPNCLEEQIRQTSLQAGEKELSHQRARWYGAYYRRDILEPKLDAFYVQWNGHPLGFGLFAKRTLHKGSPIGAYLGLVRSRSYFQARDVNAYCFSFPLQLPLWKQWFQGAWTIDAFKSGNHTRFINHSQTPNCEAVSALINSKFYIFIFAKQTIPEGAQIFYNYGPGYWQSRKDQVDPTTGRSIKKPPID